MIAEQRLLLEHLDGITSHYANHHSVDLLLEVRGTLPENRERLLSILGRFLRLSPDDQTHFVLGRRLGCYRSLSDMDNSFHHRFVENQVKKIKQAGSPFFDQIFHDLWRQVI